MGRTIRVEFAKNFRPPAPSPPSDTPKPGGYKLYAANLAWKVRSANLKEFFSEKFNPVSARVVLDSTTGKSAGYGFVGFATVEEAETAISEMNGKELMGRPLRLKISEKANDESKEPELNETELQSEEAEAATEL